MQSLLFSIADKPICRIEQKRIYGVARNEAAEILCEVDAYPPPDSFKWSFNNTAETFEMPQSDYRIHSSRASTLSYMPVKVRHLSTVVGFLQFFYIPTYICVFFRQYEAESIYLGQASYGHRHQRRRRRMCFWKLQLQREMANIKCLNLYDSFNF